MKRSSSRKKKRASFVQDYIHLRNLIRMYVIAGDKKSRKSKENILKELRKTNKDLSRHISKQKGVFAGLEFYRIMREFYTSIVDMSDAGDRNLPGEYRKHLNTLLSNTNKRLSFININLNPTADERDFLNRMMMREISSTNGYIHARDVGAMDDDSRYWNEVRDTSVLIGNLMQKKLDGDEQDESRSYDV